MRRLSRRMRSRWTQNSASTVNRTSAADTEQIIPVLPTAAHLRRFTSGCWRPKPSWSLKLSGKSVATRTGKSSMGHGIFIIALFGVCLKHLRLPDMIASAPDTAAAPFVRPANGQRTSPAHTLTCGSAACPPTAWMWRN